MHQTIHWQYSFFRKREEPLRRHLLHFLSLSVALLFLLHPLYAMGDLRALAQVLTGGGGGFDRINLVQFDRELPKLDVALIDTLSRMQGAIDRRIGIELAHFHFHRASGGRSEDAFRCAYAFLFPCLDCLLQFKFPPLQAVRFSRWIFFVHVSRKTGREVRGEGLERKGEGKGEGGEADERARDAHT